MLVIDCTYYRLRIDHKGTPPPLNEVVGFLGESGKGGHCCPSFPSPLIR